MINRMIDLSRSIFLSTVLVCIMFSLWMDWPTASGGLILLFILALLSS